MHHIDNTEGYSVNKNIHPNGIGINKNMNTYYTYIYYHPDTMLPFYVGIGKDRRRFSHLKEAKICPIPKKGQHKLNTIREILREGKEPIIKIIDSNLTRDEAKDREEDLIANIGRRDLGTGPLTNQTKGGDGFRGWSEDQKQAMRERNKRLGIVPPPQKGKKQNRRPEYTAIPAIVVATGQTTKASPNDPRWATGEIVGPNKGKVQDAEWRRKNSEGLSKLKWWNNGQKSVRSELQPGPDYVPGRSKVKW